MTDMKKVMHVVLEILQMPPNSQRTDNLKYLLQLTNINVESDNMFNEIQKWKCNNNS